MMQPQSQSASQCPMHELLKNAMNAKKLFQQKNNSSTPQTQTIVDGDNSTTKKVPDVEVMTCPFGKSFKPKHKLTYASLIGMAIEASTTKRLMLHDVYAFVEVHRCLVPTASHPNWKNSVRHNLSLRNCFRKVPRWASDGKKLSAFWELDATQLPPAATTVMSQMKFATTTMPVFPFKKYCTEEEEEDGTTTPPLHSYNSRQNSNKSRSKSSSSETHTPALPLAALTSDSSTTLIASAKRRVPVFMYNHPTPDTSDIGSECSDSDRDASSSASSSSSVSSSFNYQSHQQQQFATASLAVEFHRQQQQQQQQQSHQNSPHCSPQLSPQMSQAQPRRYSNLAYQQQQQHHHHHHQQQQQQMYFRTHQQFPNGYPSEQYNAAAQLFYASQSARYHHHLQNPSMSHGQPQLMQQHQPIVRFQRPLQPQPQTMVGSAPTPPASPRLSPRPSRKRMRHTHESESESESEKPNTKPKTTTTTPTTATTSNASTPSTIETKSTEVLVDYCDGLMGIALLAQAASRHKKKLSTDSKPTQDIGTKTQ